MSNRKLSEAEALFVDMSKPNLRALAAVLRDRALWPPKFEWYYPRCEMCAMGLASELWKQKIICVEDARDVFDIPAGKAYAIFYDADTPNECEMWAVTPEMVADQIDAVLAEAE